MSFNEQDLENLIVEKIKGLGYEYKHGNDLERTDEDILLEDDLKQFLKSKYKSEEITDDEIKSIILSLKAISSTDIYDANKRVFIRMVDGESFIRLDRTKKDFHLQLFDFENIDNNIFKVCNQVIIKGNQKRIPDTIIYIN